MGIGVLFRSAILLWMAPASTSRTLLGLPTGELVAGPQLQLSCTRQTWLRVSRLRAENSRPCKLKIAAYQSVLTGFYGKK